MLRSKTPDGIRQEAHGHLCTHYAIRALRTAAASESHRDPDRISFTLTAHAARRRVQGAHLLPDLTSHRVEGPGRQRHDVE